MSIQREPGGRTYWPALDGLRALSVSAVLLFHFGWLQNGRIGVDIFFVLSGFLITSILLTEYSYTSRIDLRRFYGRRALRLLPAMAIVVVGCVLLVLTGISPLRTSTIRGAIATVLYGSNWVEAVGHHELGLLGHTWSLAIEEQFYLLWPLILWGLMSRSWRTRTNLASIALICALTTMWRGYLWHSTGDFTRVFAGLDTRADALLVGAALALALPWLGQFSNHSMLRWLATPTALILGLLAFHGPSAKLLIYGWTGIYMLVAAFIGSMVLTPGGVARYLSWGPLVAVGRVSYGVYLWQTPVILVVDNRLSSVPTPVRFLVVIAAVGALTASSYLLVEHRFMRARRNHGMATSTG